MCCIVESLEFVYSWETKWHDVNMKIYRARNSAQAASCPFKYLIWMNFIPKDSNAKTQAHHTTWWFVREFGANMLVLIRNTMPQLIFIPDYFLSLNFISNKITPNIPSISNLKPSHLIPNLRPHVVKLAWLQIKVYHRAPSSIAGVFMRCLMVVPWLESNSGNHIYTRRHRSTRGEVLTYSKMGT